MTSPRPLLPYFLVPALPLLLPLIAMQFSAEVDWSPFDFVAAYVLLTGAGLLYRLVTTKLTSLLTRGAAALAVFGGLSLIWVNLAVGFIGNEDNPANLLYGGVLVTGLVGAALSRLEPAGLARTCFAMAAAQFVVPIVAYLGWRPNFDANVALIFALNFVWVTMFAVAGILFRQATLPSARAVA
jgi:hypothetical protein